MPPQLILGSGSPRRQELLAQIGIVPAAIHPPDVDETPSKGERPEAYCLRVTLDKVAATKIGAGDLALCADTTVAVGRRILGKPEDAQQARAFLALLSGRRHRVLTAVAVTDGMETRYRLVTSHLRFKRLSVEEVDAYMASDDWRGKAGGYAIQGPASTFVAWLSGSHSSVVGLPLFETAHLLRSFGFPVSQGWA